MGAWRGSTATVITASARTVTAAREVTAAAGAATTSSSFTTGSCEFVICLSSRIITAPNKCKLKDKDGSRSVRLAAPVCLWTGNSDECLIAAQLQRAARAALLQSHLR